MKSIVKLAAWAGICGLLLGVTSVKADISFNVTAGDWSDTNSWTPTRLPDVSDNIVYVQNSGTATVSGVATGGYGVCWVGVDAQTNKGSVVLTNGADLHVYQLYNYGNIVQYGGNLISDVGAGAHKRLRTYGCGTYLQYGGTVQGDYVHVGQQGTAGQTSTYTLVNGTINAGEVIVGEADAASGRFVQYGGTVAASVATIGQGVYGTSRGYYDQYGGTNNSAVVYVGDNGYTYLTIGYYNITNGTLNASAYISLGHHNGATGTVQVSGTANIVTPGIYVGHAEGDPAGRPVCAGYWIQDGGTVTVSSGVILGGGQLARGSYTLNGGILTTPNLTVGSGATNDATFTQTGGMLSGSTCYIGANTSTNAYMRTQGGTNACTTVYLGYSGTVTGRWDILGGTVSLGTLYTTYSGNEGSVMNLSGGTLTVTNLIMGWNPGNNSFTQSGGTNTVISQCLIGRNGGAQYSVYTMTGGKLIAPGMEVGAVGGGACTGAFHVVGMAPQVEASGYAQNANSILELTLGAGGGMRPIAVSGNPSLNGTLTIGRTNNVKFEVGTVVTVMTYNACSTAFAKTNFLDGVSCRVNYLPKMITLDQLEPVLFRGMIIAVR